MFQTLARDPSLSNRAQQQVQELIVTRALKGGDRLPSERELGEMLGVSRTVVREAIRLLAARGLVDVRSGSGTYVRDLGPEVMQDPMNLLLQANVLRMDDIHEVRTSLEIMIAGLAAERAQTSDILNLQASLKALLRPGLDPMDFASTDVAFHASLAAATQNPLFGILVNSLNSVLLEVRLRLFNNLRGIPERAYQYHSRIFERVEARDASGAQQAMREHLADTRDLLRKADEASRAEREAHNQPSGRKVPRHDMTQP